MNAVSFYESLAHGRRESSAHAFNAEGLQSLSYQSNEVSRFAQTGWTLQSTIDRCNDLLRWQPGDADDDVFLGSGGYYAEQDSQNPASPYNYTLATAYNDLSFTSSHPKSVLDSILFQNLNNNNLPPHGALFSCWLNWAYNDRLVGYAPSYYARRIRARTRPAFPCRLGSGRIIGTIPSAASGGLGYIGVTEITFNDETVIGTYQPQECLIPENDGSLGRFRFLLIGYETADFSPLPGLHLAV